MRKRETFGHWELDTVVSGRGQAKGCVATFIERKIRWYFGVLIPDRSATSMESAVKLLHKQLPKGAIQTATTDRGKEFSCYNALEQDLKIQVYFADAYSYWQRGSNENGNGLLREFFPKKTKCEDCSDCPLKELCTKAKGNRQVHYKPVYEEMKGKAKTALEDETLAALYAGRKIDVESVFGNLKGNLSFTRFLLRRFKKVRTELVLVVMAHNLRKLAGHRLANSFKNADFTFSSSNRYTSISQKTRKEVPRKVHYGLFRHLLMFH